MKDQRSPANTTVMIAIGGGLSLLAVVVALVATTPPASMLVIAGVFYACVAAGMAYALSVGARALQASGQPAEAPRIVLRMPAPSAALAVRVVAVEGACPLGYRVGDAWRIAADGGLSRPACEPAAAAFRALMARPGGAGSLRAAQCVCPSGPQRISFAAG